MSVLESLKSVRAVLAVVIGVPLVIGAAGLMAHTYMYGDGELHAAAPADSDMSVTIDGELLTTIAAGEHHELDIAQGEHVVTFELEDGTSVHHDLNVSNGFWESFSAAPQTCYVQLEVADTYYFADDELVDGMPPLPTVEKRFDDTATVSLSSRTYFGEDALPSQITEGDSIHLIEEIPCDMLEADANHLLQDWFGYEGHASNSFFQF